MVRLQLLVVAGVLLLGGSAQGSTVNRFPPFTDKSLAYFGNPIERSIEPRADEVNYRLPNNTSPLHYDVTVTTKVDQGDLEFTGRVVITIKADEDLTNTVVVHARQLENFIASISDTVTGISKNLVPTYNDANEQLTLTTEDGSVLVEGREYKVTIQYSGYLRTDNGGFYLSTYTNAAGETVNLATTQFESTNARHGFPCYDEPAKRARFTITINHSPTLTAISNMPVDEALSVSGKTVFLETPSMPTYLVAYIVSDFTSISGSLNGFTQRIFSRPETSGDREFALFAGIQLTSSLAQYYNTPFTLPKLDQVAVPDFAAGAMENWGIATYREEYLLYNPQTSTTNTQTNIANIIAHEYTHMWFGDLVTVHWWTYLWLKEGFATMFSYKAADEVYPEWDIMQLFIVGEYQSAVYYDGGASPRPMTHYVETPSQISSLYDVVSYNKAGAVLFMWQYALGDEIFSLGLNKFLSINQYTGAEEDALFDAINSAAKEVGQQLPDTVNLMMKTWTNQGGIPVLIVERNYQDGSFTITQHSYYNDASLSDERLWYVPVNYATASNPDFRNTTASHYLGNVRSITIQPSQISDTDWLVLNKRSTGYYRIQYDAKNWGLISDALIARPQRIHVNNRASLLYDAYRLSMSTYIEHKILLNLMQYLKNEDQYAPWATASSVLTAFDRLLSGDAEYEAFKNFTGTLVENIYEKLGADDVTGEQHFAKNVRTIAINLACLSGIQSCLSETNNKLKLLVSEGVEVEPNLQSVIYCNGLKQTGDVEFMFLYNRLLNSNDQAEKRLLISSLGCAQSASQIRRFIETSIDSSSPLRVQERTTLLNSAYSRGEVGLLESIDFLSENYETYADLTSGFGGANPLDSDIRGISNYVVNEQQEAELLALVQKVKEHPKVSTTLETTVQSNIKANFDWLTVNRDPIITWILENRTSGASSTFASIIPVILAACLILSRLF